VDQTGPVRREGFLGSEAVSALLNDPGGFDPAPVLTLAGEHYGPVHGPSTQALLLRPGEALARLLPGTARGGFLLDLGPSGWRSEWGGLLLFQGAEGRVQGYRPVPGALTLFPASAAPMISLIAPQGRDRASILGWWN